MYLFVVTLLYGVRSRRFGLHVCLRFIFVFVFAFAFLLHRCLRSVRWVRFVRLHVSFAVRLVRFRCVYVVTAPHTLFTWLRLPHTPTDLPVLRILRSKFTFVYGLVTLRFMHRLYVARSSWLIHTFTRLLRFRSFIHLPFSRLLLHFVHFRSLICTRLRLRWIYGPLFSRLFNSRFTFGSFVLPFPFGLVVTFVTFASRSFALFTFRYVTFYVYMRCSYARLLLLFVTFTRSHLHLLRSIPGCVYSPTLLTFPILRCSPFARTFTLFGYVHRLRCILLRFRTSLRLPGCVLRLVTFSFAFAHFARLRLPFAVDCCSVIRFARWFALLWFTLRLRLVCSLVVGRSAPFTVVVRYVCCRFLFAFTVCLHTTFTYGLVYYTLVTFAFVTFVYTLRYVCTLRFFGRLFRLLPDLPRSRSCGLDCCCRWLITFVPHLR